MILIILLDKKYINNMKKTKKNLLKSDSYWNKTRTKWKQPPTIIKHGDLVDIEYNTTTVIGRYIGKGKGVAIIPNYSTGDVFHIGYVVSRGIDMNPRQVSDEQLFEFIQD